MEVMMLIGLVLVFAPIVIASLVCMVWLIMDTVELLKNGDISGRIFILTAMCMFIGLLLMLIVGCMQIHPIL